MASHNPPSFPFTVIVSHLDADGGVISSFETPGQVRFVPSTGLAGPLTSPVALLAIVNIYLPAGTDVRGFQPSHVPDEIEAPAGSGRFYHVDAVEDVAKGFSNEFRCAVCRIKSYPIPMP